MTLTLPESWLKEDYERITFEWDPSCEAMIFDQEGLSLQAFTGAFGIDRRVDFILDPKKRSSTYKVSISSRAEVQITNAELSFPNFDSTTSKSPATVMALSGSFVLAADPLAPTGMFGNGKPEGQSVSPVPRSSRLTFPPHQSMILPTTTATSHFALPTWWYPTWKPGDCCGTSARSETSRALCPRTRRSAISAWKRAMPS